MPLIGGSTRRKQECGGGGLVTVAGVAVPTAWLIGHVRKSYIFDCVKLKALRQTYQFLANAKTAPRQNSESLK